MQLKQIVTTAYTMESLTWSLETLLADPVAARIKKNTLKLLVAQPLPTLGSTFAHTSPYFCTCLCPHMAVPLAM